MSSFQLFLLTRKENEKKTKNLLIFCTLNRSTGKGPVACCVCHPTGERNKRGQKGSLPSFAGQRIDPGDDSSIYRDPALHTQTHNFRMTLDGRDAERLSKCQGLCPRDQRLFFPSSSSSRLIFNARLNGGADKREM